MAPVAAAEEGGGLVQRLAESPPITASCEMRGGAAPVLGDATGPIWVRQPRIELVPSLAWGVYAVGVRGALSDLVEVVEAALGRALLAESEAGGLEGFDGVMMSVNS